MSTVVGLENQGKADKYDLKSQVEGRLLHNSDIQRGVSTDQEIRNLSVLNSKLSGISVLAGSISGGYVFDSGFEFCDFNSMSFHGVSFKRVNFKSCTFRTVTFESCTFEDCTFEVVDLEFDVDKMLFSRCALQNLEKATIKGAQFKDCQEISPTQRETPKLKAAAAPTPSENKTEATKEKPVADSSPKSATRFDELEM